MATSKKKCTEQWHIFEPADSEKCVCGKETKSNLLKEIEAGSKKPKKKQKERPLTKKEAGFVKDYLKTGNGTLSAKRNYNVSTDNAAAVQAHHTLRKPKVKRIIKSFADRIPDKLLEEKHLELLNVPRRVRTSVKGELVEEIEEVDSQALKAGLDMGYKLKGYYKQDEKEKEKGVDQTLASINTLITMLAEKRKNDK